MDRLKTEVRVAFVFLIIVTSIFLLINSLIGVIVSPEYIKGSLKLE
jgi:hypothetical protein